MKHIFRGECIEEDKLNDYLKGLKYQIARDLLLPIPKPEVVMAAIDKLIEQVDLDMLIKELTDKGVTEWYAKHLIDEAKKGLTKEALRVKYSRELGEAQNQWHTIEPGVKEVIRPLGVLMHIGAGNVMALSAVSVFEGLLTGNINLLKLPSYEGGISMLLLKRLLEIEPSLKPFIYVLDISSKDIDTLWQLSEVADAAVVWGSDRAVEGIRELAPPSLRLIEWGHKLSFAYIALKEDSTTRLVELDRDIKGLADEICLSNQLLCSSPQCVFVETNDWDNLERIGMKLLKALEESEKDYPQGEMSIQEMGEITWIRELAQTESVINRTKVLVNEKKTVSVIIEKEPILKPSPKYRNIWLMPIKRDALPELLIKHRGYLQTVGLSCPKKEREELGSLLSALGVNRITALGKMSETYWGEPHDGRPTLREYVRYVSFS